MNILYHRYAELIVRKALKLKPGDVLSINTEEEHSSFAHLVSDFAARATGNGSYIQIIENGKVTSSEEASTDYPIVKKPSALLYLQSYKSYPEYEEHKVYNAPELQAFRLLSEPIGNPVPSIPYAVAPIPSKEWAEVLDDEADDERLSLSLISELFSLSEDDFLDEYDSQEDIMLYECEKLNKIKFVKGRIFNEEGNDLSFELKKDAKFFSSIETTSSSRRFVPSIFFSDIFTYLDPSKIEGYLNITQPILLFGKKINNLSVVFKEGRAVSFDADRVLGEAFKLYLEQDKDAGAASMLTIAEDNNPASLIGFTGYPIWDRMRGVSITLGGPKDVPGYLTEEDMDKNPIVSLSLPIGSDSTTIILEDENGNEYTVYEDGIILEEE